MRDVSDSARSRDPGLQPTDDRRLVPAIQVVNHDWNCELPMTLMIDLTRFPSSKLRPAWCSNERAGQACQFSSSDEYRTVVVTTLRGPKVHCVMFQEITPRIVTT